MAANPPPAVRTRKAPVTEGIRYTSTGSTPTEGIKYDEERRSYDELARGGAAKEHSMREGSKAEEAKETPKEERAEEAKKERDHKKRARGGSVADKDTDEGSGNPTYFAGKDSYVEKAAKGERELKAGGRAKRVKRASGGRVRAGKMALMIEGKAAHGRLDRKRARGGGVGSDRTPLTTAHNLEGPKGDTRTFADNANDD